MKSFNFKKSTFEASFKKEIEHNLKLSAISGSESIKSELTKRNQEAKVTHSIKGNIITFVIDPQTTKIETNDLNKIQKKQSDNLKKVLGPVPIEMLNDQMSENSISTVAIDIAMERIQDKFIERIDDSIEKLL